MANILYPYNPYTSLVSTGSYQGPSARKSVPAQGSKIALVRSYLRVSQVAGQVIILIFLVKIKFFPIYANRFCDAGQVPIFRYFEACRHSPTLWAIVTNDLCIRRCRAQSNNVTPINISCIQPPRYYFFLILLSVAYVICVLELSSKQHRP